MQLSKQTTQDTHTSQPAISSLEIAEITGKPHRNVTADIERILKEAEIDAQGFLHTYKDAQKRNQNCYILPRRECDLVVSGYSVKYRLAIIDRWHELEAKEAKQTWDALNDPATMRGILLSYVERLIAAEDTLKLQAPKVEFFDKAMESSTLCQLAVAVQVAGLPFKRNKLFEKLRDDGILISGGTRHNLPKQTYIDKGLFTVEENSYKHPISKEPIVAFTTHVTQKGIDFLIRNYSNQATATDESQG